MDQRRPQRLPLSKSPRRISRAASELHLALSLYPGRFVNQSSGLIARLAARHAARTSPFARVKPCYFLLPRDDLIRRGARGAIPSSHGGIQRKVQVACVRRFGARERAEREIVHRWRVNSR